MASQQYPEADIVVLTMFAEHAKVLSTIRAGASGYLLKDRPLAECVTSIREIRRGGAPINPVIARLVMKELQAKPPQIEVETDKILSDRELQTLQLLSRGFSYAECADIMEISAHTVATFVKHIYRKLEVHSRAEAVFEASSRGILDG
jgi:DNA-binding NarL/FixJ family response regulator